MKILVRVTTEDGELLATIQGHSLDDECTDDDCEHDSHFVIEYVREGRGFAQSMLADDIVRCVE